MKLKLKKFRYQIYPIHICKENKGNRSLEAIYVAPMYGLDI